MAESSAYEVRHKGRIYRASDRDTLHAWARELRISANDLMRKAGGEEWHPVSDDQQLAELLSPESWWHVTIDGETYTAPDFDALVRWAREGRLTTDAEIEGPRTPPGGVLASGLPRLAPYLKEPPNREGEEPPRLSIDGREYLPGDTETLRGWIQQSRVPPEAEICLSGGDWEPIGECGLFEPELWPEGAWGQPPEDAEPEEPEEEPSKPSNTTEDREGTEAPEEEAPPSTEPPEENGVPAEVPGFEEEGVEEEDGEEDFQPYVIETLQGRFEASAPKRVKDLLSKKQVHTFDRVVHPELPDGECSVEEFLSMKGLGRSYLWVWILIVVLLAAAAVLFFDPFGLELLGGGTQGGA